MNFLFILLSVTVSAIVPYFEVGINGKVLNSENARWKASSQTSMTLDNGGTVETTKFLGQGEWKGLEVEWDRETFEGDDEFVRERLRLRSTKPGKFRFSNIEGKCRMVFPRHFIPGAASEAEEIRLATFDKDILPGYNADRAMDVRSPRNPSGCHMFHPARYSHMLPCEVKGPFLCATIGSRKVILSYEHASQDNTWMNKTSGNDDIVNGTEIYHRVSDDDLWFISLSLETVPGGISASGSVRRGAYFDGEAIPSEGWYETVWYTMSFPKGDTDEAIRSYLLTKITDNKGARKPNFYYNTWGMQRSLPGIPRENFTKENVLSEIDRAAILGVEVFVFDDGWQDDFGVWTANRKRLPEGLEPLIAAVREKGMVPGIWLGLLACNQNAPVAMEHPEWLVSDPGGKIRTGGWGQCQADITGGYYNHLLKALKNLVDLGIRYFKWDGIDVFSSDLPGLGHGTKSTPVNERIDRYNYLLPFRVTSLMRELRKYCPDVVIEIDLTEHERALCGLMPLQEGKLFWMNNGSSWYGDYSLYRTKSMRMVAAEYASLIPCEALTYAVYPFDVYPWHSLQHNLCTTIQMGHGYWGNLAECSASDYEAVSYYTMNARRVLGKVAGAPVKKMGTVGSVPEIYVQQKDGYALLTAFSGTQTEYEYTIGMDSSKVLGVIGHAFTVTPFGICIPMQFSFSDDCRAAFVVGNDGQPFRVLSSTGWIKTLEIRDGNLYIEAGSPTDMEILLPSGKVIQHLKAGETVKL